jgi:hypothetical protein
MARGKREQAQAGIFGAEPKTVLERGERYGGSTRPKLVQNLRFGREPSVQPELAKEFEHVNLGVRVQIGIGPAFEAPGEVPK